MDYYANWCAPCRWMAEEVLNKLSAKYSGRVKFVRVDVDDADIGDVEDIKSIPQFRFFEVQTGCLVCDSKACSLKILVFVLCT